jgi:hypothetical protein
MESGTYYLKYNVLKTHILTELKRAKKKGEEGITCQMIADRTGIPRHKITDIMGKWHRKHYNYAQRLDKKEPGGNHKAYRYAITEYGEKALKQYNQRIHDHYNLNIKRKGEDVGLYIGITPKGSEMGITVKNVTDEFKSVQKEKNQVDNYK